jgi:hypothetical protein
MFVKALMTSPKPATKRMIGPTNVIAERFPLVPNIAVASPRGISKYTPKIRTTIPTTNSVACAFALVFAIFITNNDFAQVVYIDTICLENTILENILLLKLTINFLLVLRC